MVLTKIFPEKFKVSRVIPLKKAGKPGNEMSSYWPISILPALEKIIEAIMKTQLEAYFEANKLIPDGHHGGRPSHSTITALAALETHHAKIKDSKKTTVILSTDISSAFNTIDHQTLLEKLRYYGLENNAIELLKSFLGNRKCFVELQSFRSKTTKCPDCSVIQGSRLSGFLYTVYAIEIPALPKVLRNKNMAELLLEMEIPQFYGVMHEVIQYVDDSNNTVGTDSIDEMTRYLNIYLQLLQTFYDANKLLLNKEKMTFIVTRKNTGEIRRLELNGPNNTPIKESNAIKLLGIWRNNRNSYDTHLTYLSIATTKAINQLQPLLKHMSTKTRKEVISAKCASISNYGLELLYGQTDWTAKKLTAVKMKCNRAIYKGDTFKVSNRRICKEIQTDEPMIECKKAVFKFIHKVVRTQKPPQLFKFIKFNRIHRDCARIGLIDAPHKETNKRTLMYKSIELYNCSNPNLKMLTVKNVKSRLKKLGDKILTMK